MEVWAAPLEGGRYAVAVVNRSPTPALELAIDFKDLPMLQPSSAFRIRDIWNAKDLPGLHSDSYVVPGVDPFGTGFFILTPA